MISQALMYIAGKINQAFFTPAGTPRVILGNVTILNDPAVTESNVLLSLVNIEEEKLLRNPETSSGAINRSYTAIRRCISIPP
jgi:hypothetical protein